MSKYVKPYKSYFVKEDPRQDQFKKIHEAYQKGSRISFKHLYSLDEAVIRTDKYANLLTNIFKGILRTIEGKMFVETKDLTKHLNMYFDEFGITFIFDGYNRDSDGSGIMGALSTNEEFRIVLYCDQYLRPNVKTNNKLLIQTFNEFMLHELTHRGQFLLRNLDRLHEMKAKTTDYGFKQYLQDKHEIMAYANQAVEELYFQGLTQKEIIIMIKSFNFVESKSTSIKFYMDNFSKYNKDDLVILKRFFKYMYEYLVGDIKREYWSK